MRALSTGLKMGPMNRLIAMLHTGPPKPKRKLAMDVYTKLAEIPMPVSAQFRSMGKHGESPSVEVTYVVRDHLENTKKIKLKTMNLSGEAGQPSYSSVLLDAGDTVAQTYSPSKRLRAVMRVVKGESMTTRLLEIWKEDLLVHSLDVTKLHGDFYTDEYLASFSFSFSGNSLVYSAERNPPSSDNPFEHYKFNPDFGEGLVGKKSPGLFLLRLSTEDSLNTPTLRATGPVLVDTPSHVRFGQATFSPLSEDTLYATGYELTQDGRILGLRYCFNRPSGIWELILSPTYLKPVNATTTIPVTSSKITPSHLSCRSPRTFFHGSNAKLLWLSSATGGPHLSADSLFSADIKEDTPSPTDIKPLVDVVDVPQDDGFPGLYLPYNLPSSPVLNLSTSSPLVIVDSQWGSRSTILGISSTTGKVTDLTPDNDGLHFSWSVLATDGSSRILATRSTPSVPYELMLGGLNEDGIVDWSVLETPCIPQQVQEALNTIQTKIIPIPDRGLVETIVTQSSLFTKGGAIPPCITWPHGGPHVGAYTVFSPLMTSLVLEGYTISQPNYTGSLGYGDSFVRALLGSCGELDVEDCMASAEHLIQLGISERGSGKQLVTGGSHGGFLTGHLVGQYPTFFSAAVLRNAVTNATNIATTDIPDWYFSEFGFASQYHISSSSPASASLTRIPTRLPSVAEITPSMYDALLKASPIFYADRVCIPVLILAGTEDRRVAPSHSVEYYHALKGRVEAQPHGVVAYRDDGDRGLEVELLMFKGECHSLDGVETSKVNFEVMREWFAKVQK